MTPKKPKELHLPAGRPTKYKAEYCETARKLCLLGAVDTELADFLNIDISTLNNWKLKHPAFVESIKSGKLVADAKVAEKLYTRAIGYSYDETTIEYSGDGETVAKKKITTKEVSPDTTAQIFFLKNRQPKYWRDKNYTDSTNTNINITPEDEDAFAKWANILQKTDNV